MDAESRFSSEVIKIMKKDVSDASGNEVFWVGIINEDGIVVKIEAASRGNADSVVVNRTASRNGHVLIHNHPGGNLTPSEEDEAVAFNATDTSHGFYIVNNSVSKVYVVVEPVKPKKTYFLDENECAFLLSKDGPLAQKNPLYEERAVQLELVKNIAKSFNEEKIGVFEAGTGVGKSFAYLIPSILWASKNKERVVISTGTINLQQQLFEKDIPLAKKITGSDIKAVLVKGRQNYLCLRRMNDALDERDLFTEDSESLEKILEWSKTTSSGSVSELSFVPEDSLWSRVNSESDACMGSRCPFREKCFVMKNRKEASDANLIVVNHHLLFADIESRMETGNYDDAVVLPPYRHIVFDEAHGIEDSATSFFSEGLNRFRLTKQLNLLYRGWRSSVSGFLVQADAVVFDADDFLPQVSEKINAVKEAMAVLEDETQLIMDTKFTERIFSATYKTYSRTFSAMEKLKKSLDDFVNYVRSIFENNISEEDSDIASVWESKNILRRLEDIAVLCGKFILWKEHEDSVFWLEKVKLPPKKAGDDFITFVKFSCTPLDVAPLMQKGVFEPMKTVICTSATLKTGPSFSYWMRRTGVSFIEDERLLTGEFLSPFPYTTNVVFGVTSDAPFPDSQYFQSFVESALPSLIKAAGGKTLVLFTSYESLRSAYKNCSLSLSKENIPLMKQGDDDRFRLMEHFKNDTRSVLFATESFWEGVDVPGESLSQVIIVKLPFAVPNDPVFAARSELVEKRGGSSFMELSVPQAVIKFRQGFGRLMRHSDDRGAIIVLDRRIVEKQYGKLFTQSVPKTRRMYNPVDYISREVEKIIAPDVAAIQS